jgi:hypothetical protein
MSSKAFVETTVLANALLKPGDPRCAGALAAIKRYTETLLPVYAIKELKAGIIKNYAWFHQKLVQTKSLSRTIQVVNSLHPSFQAYRKGSSLEALSTAVSLTAQTRPANVDFSKDEDEELADRYRLSIELLLKMAWDRRRTLTTQTVQDLDCYTESAPVLNDAGVFNLIPNQCDTDECSLADELKAQPEALQKMWAAIPSASTKSEDVRRKAVLRDLIRLKRFELTPDRCRSLGDAVFAFFAPPDSVILTTNKKDMEPLAKALGKNVETP